MTDHDVSGPSPIGKGPRSVRKRDERVVIHELLAKNALILHDAKFELFRQYSLSKVLGDKSIDPTLTRELLRKAIEALECSADTLVDLAIDSRRVLSRRPVWETMTRMTVSFMLAIMLCTGLSVSAVRLIEYINPSETIALVSQRIVVVPEAKP